MQTSLSLATPYAVCSRQTPAPSDSRRRRPELFAALVRRTAEVAGRRCRLSAGRLTRHDGARKQDSSTGMARTSAPAISLQHITGERRFSLAPRPPRRQRSGEFRPVRTTHCTSGEIAAVRASHRGENSSAVQQPGAEHCSRLTWQKRHPTRGSRCLARPVPRSAGERGWSVRPTVPSRLELVRRRRRRQPHHRSSFSL